MSFRFEDLQVWQKAIDLDEKINQLTKTFPKEEIYILTSHKKGCRFCRLKYSGGSTGQTKSCIESFFELRLAFRDRSCELFIYCETTAVR